MDYLKQVLHRLAEIARQMSPSQAVILVALVVGTIVGTVAIVGWVGQAAYQPLYTNLEPAEAAEVTKYLAEKGVPYKFGPGGTSIEVP